MPKQKPITHKRIKKAIKKLRKKYLQKEMPPESTYYDINNGNCEEFAYYVLKHLNGGKETKQLYFLCNDSFMIYKDDDHIWDIDLIKKYWPNVAPLKGSTLEDLNRIRFGTHVWLFDGTRHYDAECPKGTKNFLKLPIFKRKIKRFVSKSNKPIC